MVIKYSYSKVSFSNKTKHPFICNSGILQRTKYPYFVLNSVGIPKITIDILGISLDILKISGDKKKISNAILGISDAISEIPVAIIKIAGSFVGISGAIIIMENFKSNLSRSINL